MIKKTIDEISEKYNAGMFAWLEGKNKLAVKQLDVLADKINAQYVAGETAAAEKTLRIWKNSIIFWSDNFKKLGGANA